MNFDEFWDWLDKGKLEFILDAEPLFRKAGLEDKCKIIDAYLKQLGQR
jgi:hypothetical protein